MTPNATYNIDALTEARSLPVSFWSMDDNSNYFRSAGELLSHFYNKNSKLTDEELWYALQDLSRPMFDPLRVVEVEYRPFEKKRIYYGHSMGLISHPRYNAMKHLLPWYWDYAIIELLPKMEKLSYQALKEVIKKSEKVWFELPLNAHFLANLNVWRVAVWLNSESAKQGELIFL